LYTPPNICCQAFFYSMIHTWEVFLGILDTHGRRSFKVQTHFLEPTTHMLYLLNLPCHTLVFDSPHRRSRSKSMEEYVRTVLQIYWLASCCCKFLYHRLTMSRRVRNKHFLNKLKIGFSILCVSAVASSSIPAIAYSLQVVQYFWL
jgi:hypothetical protein